jgi:hypothetical protein
MISETAPQKSRIARLVVLAGLIVPCMATLTPGDAYESISGLCVICGDLGGVDAVLNVLLFVPLGFGLGLMRVSWWKAIGTCILLTVIIESLQFRTVLGRDASAGDLITNSVGGALGITLGRSWPALVKPGPGTRAVLIAGALAAWAAVSVITGYALQPRPGDPPFYGQLARERSTDPPYPGAVEHVQLGGIRIPDREVPGSAEIPAALRAGHAFTMRVTPREVPSWFSPIARVADRHDVEHALIAARGPDAVFRVRTNAAFLRFRPYAVGIRDALHPTSRAVTISGTFHRGNARLVVAGDIGSRESDVVFGLASGWRLILPFNSVATGSALQNALDVLWFSLLIIPAAYWSTALTRGWRLVAVAAGLAAVMIGGVLLIDAAMALTPVLPDIVGVASGIAMGSLFGRFFPGRAGYQSGRDKPAGVSVA